MEKVLILPPHPQPPLPSRLPLKIFFLFLKKKKIIPLYLILPSQFFLYFLIYVRYIHIFL